MNAITRHSIEPGGTLRRTLEIDTATIRAADKAARTVEASISSDIAYQRWPDMAEVLDHSPQAVDLSRAREGLAVLLHHDETKVIGVAEGFRLDAGKLRATLRFGQSADASAAWSDVQAGILRHVSVGYTIQETQRSGPETLNVTRWTPHEVSLVAIPADITVGIGRSLSSKEHPMTSETLPKPADKAGDALTERNRISEILAIGRQFKCADDAETAIRGGVTIERFRSHVLDKLGSAHSGTMSNQNDMGLSRRDQQDWNSFSLGKAIRAHITKDYSEAGLERQVSRELEKTMGRGAKGFFAPSNALVTRAMSVAQAGKGGYLVDTDQPADMFIEMLKPQSVLAAAGATFLPGLMGNLALPRKTGATTANWVGETDSVPESDLALGNVNMGPKTVAGRVVYSRRLLLQSMPAVDELIKADLVEQIALAIDAGGLTGTGTANQPQGVKNTTGISTQTFSVSGTPAFAEIVSMEGKIDAQNALNGTMAYIAHPTMVAKMKTTQKVSGQAIFLWEEGNRVNGYAGFRTTQIAATELYFGNWQDLLIGLWGGVDMVIDEYSKSQTQQIAITAFQTVDVAPRHVESFCLGS